MYSFNPLWAFVIVWHRLQTSCTVPVVWAYHSSAVLLHPVALCTTMCRSRSDAWCCLLGAKKSNKNHYEVPALLEYLGKTPVVLLLGPWHEKPRNVFAQPPELENQGDKYFCKRHDQYRGSVSSQVKSSKQVSKDNTMVLCPGTRGEFPMRRLDCVVTQAP